MLATCFQCEGVPQAKKLIGQLLELIPPIKSSVSLGIQAEEREVTKNGNCFKYLCQYLQTFVLGEDGVIP
jgi:hypothetical protein